MHVVAACVHMACRVQVSAAGMPGWPSPACCVYAPAAAPAATAAEVLKAVAEKQGWQAVDSLLRLEGEGALGGLASGCWVA